jgi:hypothetical protein
VFGVGTNQSGRAARRTTTPLLIALTVVLLAFAAAGCSTSGPATDSSATSAADNAYSDSGGDESGVDVPDVVGEDGSDAVSDAEAVGLTTSLADGTGEDNGFDPSRDPSGCDVTDQDPAAGETAAEGDDLEISLDCRQTDWDNQEGSAWDSYNDAYSSAFDDGCQELFNLSPNGSLYEDGVEYTVVDCQSLNPGDGSDDSDLPSDVPDDPEGVGTELGETAGCRSLFDGQGVGSLNYGLDSITADDCPVAAAATSSGSERSKSHGASSSHRTTSGLSRVSRAVGRPTTARPSFRPRGTSSLTTRMIVAGAASLQSSSSTSPTPAV